MSAQPSQNVGGLEEPLECEPFERFRKAYEAVLEPTEEDIKRQMTDEELKKLCVRCKPRVHMDKWNSVHDYVLRFQRENRLEKRTPERRLRLLARAVNMHKNHAVYTDQQVQHDWQDEWRYRKKASIMLLDQWEQDERAQTDDNVSSETQEEYVDNITDIEDDAIADTVPQLSNHDVWPSRDSLAFVSPVTRRKARANNSGFANDAFPVDFLNVHSESMTLDSEMVIESQTVIESEDMPQPATQGSPRVFGSQPVMSSQRILTPSLEASFAGDFNSMPMTCTSTQAQDYSI